MLVFLLFLAIGIILLSWMLTKENKRNRIVTGIVLILSVLTYPLFLGELHEMNILEGIEGTGALILFYLILLIGGMITLIAGFFTKNKLKEGIEKEAK